METNRLYHYCKLSTAIELILSDKQLLLNALGKTNDPRENKSFVFAASSMNAFDMANLNDRNSKISHEMRSDCKMLCSSRDNTPYFGYELSRMWALYGDNHKGVCIELNKKKFIQENQNTVRNELSKKVTYHELNINKPIDHKVIDYERIEQIGLTNYIRNEFRKENTDYLLFTKNKEWESEQEFRLVYFSDNMDNEYCKINNCIENIYLGVDFNEQYLPAIKNNCNGINICRLEYKEVRLVAAKNLV